MTVPEDNIERTPEERQRARQEREARRAARERGGAPPAAPQARSSDGDGSDAAPPGAAGAASDGAGPPPAGPPVRPPLTRPRAPSRPAPTFFDQSGEPPPARDGGARAGPPLGGRGLVPALIAAGVVVLILWFLLSLFQPFKGAGEGEVQVEIPAGAGVGEIGDVLEERGVVSSSFFFSARARLGGSAGELKSGSYTLRNDMSYSAALDALSAAPEEPKLVTATVPEGLSRTETESVVEDAGLEGDYLDATKRSKLLDPADYGAEGASDLEGFLFPATYELESGASVEDLVAQQLDAFEREFESIDLKQAKRANLTEYDVLTIASMIEREAQLDEERPVIASVIYNRLADGMPLGIDATIRFATENWTQPLTESDLAIESPYNTRTNTGLPPGPIGSPGRASIEAAANPEDTSFLYYVVKPGTCGEHSFSETDAEFQADVERYNSERAARGGQSPTDC